MEHHRHSPVHAEDVPCRTRPTVYPPPLAMRVAGRQKRQLGDLFGLSRFGVNLTTLAPGSESALLHRHDRQEEFIYILAGSPTLRTSEGEFALAPGMCVGFVPGGAAHHIVNRSDEEATFLEIGDRTPGDSATYPDDDLVAVAKPAGGWLFTRKDGTPY